MLKKLGIPMMALAGMLAFGSPKPAEAKVHVGVEFGAPPVYPYCTAYDPYCAPYAYSPYAYPAPYVYGSWGGHHGHHHEHHGHEFHGHEHGEHHH